MCWLSTDICRLDLLGETGKHGAARFEVFEMVMCKSEF